MLQQILNNYEDLKKSKSVIYNWENLYEKIKEY